MSFDIFIPYGWASVKLSDLGEVNRGRSRHRPRYAEHLYGGPYPFVQTGDIKASGGRISSYSQTYSEDGLKQSRLWPEGTLCITIAANIAETGILNFPACFPDSVIGFVADPEKCDVYFIEYCFRVLRKDIQRQATGSVQDNINLQTLERLRFPIPALSEQRRIASVLCRLDEKITLNTQINQTLEQMAQALFKSWFVDFDPVIDNALEACNTIPEPLAERAARRQAMWAVGSESAPARLPAETRRLFPDRFEEDEELGWVPEGWAVKPLDKIARYQNGLALQKFRPKEGEDFLPVLKIAQLRAGKTDGVEKASVNIKPECIVHNGDVVFSWSGTLMIDMWSGGEAALNQHLFKVTSEKHPKWFYFLWTQRHLELFQRIAADKAVTMGHIKRQHLAEAFCLVPDGKLINKAGELIKPLIDKMLSGRLENEELTQLRDTLLPKLLSGELTLGAVEDAEPEAEEVMA